MSNNEYLDMDPEEIYTNLEGKYNSLRIDIENCDDEEKLKELKEKKKHVVYEMAYYKNILQDRCGYWSVCSDHYTYCACSPTAKVSQGFDYDTYCNLRKEYFSS